MINYIYALNYLMDAISEVETAFKSNMSDTDFNKFQNVIKDLYNNIEIEIAKHDLKIDNLNG